MSAPDRIVVRLRLTAAQARRMGRIARWERDSAATIAADHARLTRISSPTPDDLYEGD